MVLNIINRKNRISSIFESSVNSYSQVFFSDNKIFGVILLVVSFFDFWAGLSGLFSVIVTNFIAYNLGFNRFSIKKGTYGFNSLLVGLGTGLSFQPSIELLFVVIFASILTLFISLLIEGVFAKYYLPFLSIPFLFGLWIVMLSSRDFMELGLSERGIYTTNELFLIGGKNLVDIYNYFENIFISEIISTYFLSLASIFFQYNIFAGILIAVGLFFYSRIAFLLSIIGYSTAYAFYYFIGADITQYGYAYIGFNYILMAIAIGGHFLIPTKQSFLWVVLLLPVVVLITLSLSRLLAPYQLAVYSLPFNIVVILFLYILKLRYVRNDNLTEVILQLNNPEKNLYYHNQAVKRFKWLDFFPISLPFMGEWTVSQAENGEFTHKDEWKYAWDFVITDNNKSQFKNNGDLLEDYFCYGKTLSSPADGIIVEIIDGINDNIIGDVDLINNWGNSIVIKHTEYLYSQLSHLKKDSFKVKKGEFIRKGDIIAQCGNSGRSPYPHLHFQIQTTPFVGSKTIDYPINHYVSTTENNYELLSFNKPKLNQKVSNIKISSILKNAMNFTPGQELEFKVKLNNEKEIDVLWNVETDAYNNSYIHCKQTNSFVYLYNDNNISYFKNFIGSKKSALYYFYLSIYNVSLGFYKDVVIEDTIPINIVFNKYLMILQDIFAPFFLFFKSKYKLIYYDIDNELSPEKIILKSEVNNYFYKKNIKKMEFNIEIDSNGISEINLKNKLLIKRKDNL